ncbi:hypothetical protein BKA62DRAFT_829777 [Auriculariales sp. MPI-PUGE-AT-0066]|nr:hypothetical protein BKA62DRAFT_829777 [Auriculariales sp. MPI-PUGE-AT-0066]
MRPLITLIGPFAALVVIHFTLGVEAISACDSLKYNTQFGSLAIDLRVKGTKNSGDTYISDLKDSNGVSFTTGQRDCRSRPSFKLDHCWTRKDPPQNNGRPVPRPGPKPKPKPGVPDYWVPNYNKDSGMKNGGATNCDPMKKTEVTTWTCDHILELNFLKRAMELPNGACDKALESSKTAAEYKNALGMLREIRQTANDLPNLAFHHGKTGTHANSPEDFKTETVVYWQRSGSIRSTAADVWYLGGLNDYINVREKSVLANVGLLADKKIKEYFPDAATNVHDEWQRFQRDVETAFKTAVEADKKRLADEDARKKQEAAANAAAADDCDTPGDCLVGCSKSGTTRSSIRAAGGSLNKRRIARRHAAAGFDRARTDTTRWSASGRIISSLTERAAPRGAPRSGPHAPPAKSCPCKQQPAKKQIPRSKVTTRAPPATLPRRPQQIPPAKQPARPKQVVKRPANRPLRVPGQKAQIRRASPKRKPKTVPLPTQKPKGKSRPRRRR